MKRLWLLITASLFLTACGAGASGIGPIASTADFKPKVGDTVAVLRQRDGCGEGVVEAIEGSKYKIKYGSSSSLYDESDLYPLPKQGARPALKSGDLVAAKLESGVYYAPVEVSNVTGDVVEVKSLYYEQNVSVSPDKIIVLRPSATAELQKLKAENEFAKKAQTAKPRVPAGYKPKVGDRIVGGWGTHSWWDGDVVAVAGEKVKIKWESFGETEITADKVIPYPKVETARTLPAANSYVLIKPEGGKGQWFYAQVTAVSGDSADVKFANGKTRTIKADDYIALS